MYLCCGRVVSGGRVFRADGEGTALDHPASPGDAQLVAARQPGNVGGLVDVLGQGAEIDRNLDLVGREEHLNNRDYHANQDLQALLFFYLWGARDSSPGSVYDEKVGLVGHRASQPHPGQLDLACQLLDVLGRGGGGSSSVSPQWGEGQREAVVLEADRVLTAGSGDEANLQAEKEKIR